MSATEPNENRKQSLIEKEQRMRGCAALHKENITSGKGKKKKVGGEGNDTCLTKVKLLKIGQVLLQETLKQSNFHI